MQHDGIGAAIVSTTTRTTNEGSSTTTLCTISYSLVVVVALVWFVTTSVRVLALCDNTPYPPSVYRYATWLGL